MNHELHTFSTTNTIERSAPTHYLDHMVKALVLAALVLVSSTAPSHAQVSSSCVVPPYLSGAYERDVKSMAVRRMRQVQSPDSALIDIPTAWLDTIWSGLAAIYNTTSTGGYGPIAESDSAFSLYCVHDLSALGGIVHEALLIRLDLNEAWTVNWTLLNPISGNQYIDSLVSLYGITIESFLDLGPGWQYVSIHIPVWINSWALGEALMLEPGVMAADPECCIGDAGRIFYDRNGSGSQFIFQFEWQDCQDGCDNARAWKFNVSDACEVVYDGFEWYYALGVFTPLPSPIGCVSTVGLVEDHPGSAFGVFPNPASGSARISGWSPGVEGFVHDAAGRLVAVLRGPWLDLSTWKAGHYTLSQLSQRTSLVVSD